MFTELMNYHICFPAKWVGQNNMAKNMGAFNKNNKTWHVGWWNNFTQVIQSDLFIPYLEVT